MKKIYQEIEVRFLEVDKKELIQKLKHLGAKDLGEKLIKETIFYDQEGIWVTQEKFVRVRGYGSKVEIAFKHHKNKKDGISEVKEVELVVDNFETAVVLLKEIGLNEFRWQEKYRHSLKLGGLTFDIDTWPRVPAYLEIEGPSENKIKAMSKKLGLDWSKVVFEDAGRVLNNYYNIPAKSLKYFTFERVE